MQALTIVLLILGVIFLAIELIIPGFGVFGVLGLIFISISGIATILFFKFGLIVVLIELIFIISVLYILIKKLKSKQLFSKIILSDNTNDVKEFANLEDFIGREGITKTVLRPAGNAEFNGVIMEVISDSGYIENNKKIKCIRILNNKIYVKKSNSN